MRKSIKNPWDLSIYKDLNGNYVLEVLGNVDSNDNNKYWINLDYVTIIGHLGDTRNKIINKNYSIGFNKYFAPYEQKYIPVDSSNYRIGLLKIPYSAVINSINYVLSGLKEKMKEDIHNIDPNIHIYRSVHVEFTFEDDKGNKRIQNTSEFPL